MGKKRSQAMSRDSFIKAFVEAEILMRRNLATRIDEVIAKEENSDIIAGLNKAKEIIIGVLNES